MCDKCCVCYDDNTNLIKTQCNHYICVKCFYKLKEKLCPLCRRQYNEQLLALQDTFDICMDTYNYLRSS